MRQPEVCRSVFTSITTSNYAFIVDKAIEVTMVRLVSLLVFSSVFGFFSYLKARCLIQMMEDYKS